jgi:molybdate transport system permease protein
MTVSRSPRRLPRQVPLGIVIVGCGGAALLILPLVGLLWRAPWSDAMRIISSDAVTTPLRLSIVTSAIATVVSVLLGFPLAWVLARAEFPGRAAVRALCTLSMVLPPVVGGVALLAALGRRGLVGRWLDSAFGIRIAFTTTAVILAQSFVALPFFVLTVEAALRQHDQRAEEAARSLGASSMYVMRRVIAPAVRPAMVAGAVLAWARSLGEFGATLTFAGSFPGQTQTLPLAVAEALESDPGVAIILSLLLFAIGFAVLIALRSQWMPQLATANASQGETAVLRGEVSV